MKEKTVAKGSLLIKTSQFRKQQANKGIKKQIHTFEYKNNKISEETISTQFFGGNPSIAKTIEYTYGNDSLNVKPQEKKIMDEKNNLIETKAYSYTPDGFFEFEKTLTPDGRYKGFIKSIRFKHEILQGENEMFPIP